MSLPLHYQPITELARMLRKGDISAVELVTHYIDRCDTLNDELHAIITVAREPALRQAEEADRVLRESPEAAPPLTGIPLVVKDVIPVVGMPATYNSRIKCNDDGSDWLPDREPRAIGLLREAGVIFLGKANNNEFLGIPSDDDRFPRPRSPYNRAFVSTGSSSGSGVAPAAGMCAAGIGTDSAGSVRLPAAQHGLVGHKATNGLITRAGMGYSSLQVMGPLARTTADAALIYEALTANERPVSDALQTDISGWRVGVPWRYIETAPVEDEILRGFRAAVDQLAAMGVEIVDLRIRGLAETREATFVVLYTEHHASHTETLHSSYNAYGDSARLYAMQGAFISAIDYMNALEMGRQLTGIVNTAMNGLDAILTPVCPFVTAEAGRRPSEHRQGINTAFTGPFNLTGHPAITVTCGVAENGMPFGMQLAGHHYRDKRLFQLAHAYEQATGWHQLYPDL